MSSGPDNAQINVHMYGQTFTWCLLLNVTICCALLKYDRVAALAHAVMGSCIFLLTYFFILWFLAPYGFIQSQKQNIYYYLHAILGCAMLGFVALQAAGGLFARIYQYDPNSNIFRLKIVRNVHKFFGYFLAVLYKINVIWNWYGSNLFYFLVAWETASIILLVYLKFFASKLENKIIDKQTAQTSFQLVDKSRLALKEKPYVVFGNYVYDASQLKRLHPGGQKVIETILGREVDRFLYGMYSSELYPELSAYSHSANALKLVGKPIYKLDTPITYYGFAEQPVKVEVTHLSLVSKKTQIYAIGLSSLSQPFNFKSYSEAKQLGQYYSLTLDGKVTRLYTAVNFLVKENIVLINKIIPEFSYPPLDKVYLTFTGKTNTIELRDKEVGMIDKQSRDQLMYLPIMLKIYENGKFTSFLQKKNFKDVQIEISPPKGLGLELESTLPGRIIIVTGGTGLFPFSDFIDLAFKAQLVEENHALSAQILERNPILRLKPFAKFSFVLMIAVAQPEDIHPITLRQLAKLSQHQARFKVVLRISKNASELQNIPSGFEFSRDYFSKRLLVQVAAPNFSRVWICGPPRMSTQTATSLLDSGFPRESFLLV